MAVRTPGISIMLGGMVAVFALLAGTVAASAAGPMEMKRVYEDGGACEGDYSHTRGSANVSVAHGQTRVDISLKRARPNSYYTVWLRLKETSPLTGRGATALVDPSKIDVLIPATPRAKLEAGGIIDPNLGDETGTAGGTTGANGFWTGNRGNGRLKVVLDFDITKEYPFNEYDDALAPVAINTDRFFTVASHCTDGIGHGLVAGTNEGWFDFVGPIP